MKVAEKNTSRTENSIGHWTWLSEAYKLKENNELFVDKFLEVLTVQEAEHVDESIYRFIGMKDGFLVFKKKKKYEDLDVPEYPLSENDVKKLLKDKFLKGKDIILKIVD